MPRTLHRRLLLLSARKMIVPRGIMTYISLPERQFMMTMNATVRLTNQDYQAKGPETTVNQEILHLLISDHSICMD